MDENKARVYVVIAVLTAMTIMFTVSKMAPSETIPTEPDNYITDEPLEPRYSTDELIMLAKTVWGEARGLAPDEQRLVAWTVFQRVDAKRFGDTIEAVLTAPNQFYGYKARYPVEPNIYEIVCAEAAKWQQGEPAPTMEPYAPAVPYYYFEARIGHNWFGDGWK